MKDIVESIVGRYYETSTKSIRDLGGGFYGRVFLAEISKEPVYVVLKIYLYQGLAEREQLSIRLIAAGLILS